eukprot:SAG31_NODE_9811_length_1224_cov_1.172444_1_plen_222_part_00
MSDSAADSGANSDELQDDLLQFGSLNDPDGTVADMLRAADGVPGDVSAAMGATLSPDAAQLYPDHRETIVPPNLEDDAPQKVVTRNATDNNADAVQLEESSPNYEPSGLLRRDSSERRRRPGLFGKSPAAATSEPVTGPDVSTDVQQEHAIHTKTEELPLEELTEVGGPQKQDADHKPLLTTSVLRSLFEDVSEEDEEEEADEVSSVGSSQMSFGSIESIV